MKNQNLSTQKSLEKEPKSRLIKNIPQTSPLQELHTKADQIITSHLNRLDQVSMNIKEIETKLQKAAIPFTFIYTISTKKKYCASGDRRINSDYVYTETIQLGDDITSDVFEFSDHCLVWSQTSNGSNLLYNIYTTFREFAKFDGEELVKTTVQTDLKFSKPLSQTKAVLRMKVEKDLFNFYEGIIKRLNQEQNEEYYFTQSPMYLENSNAKLKESIVESNFSNFGIFPTCTLEEEIPF